MHFENYYRAFVPQLNSVVDFTNRTFSFHPSFEGFLDVFRDAFADNNRFDTELLIAPTEEDMQALQDRYVFLRPILATGLYRAR